MWEFHSDGAADFSIGGIMEQPWRIENDQMIFPPDTVGGAELKLTLKWLSPNKLSLANLAPGDSGSLELIRVGGRTEAANPIMGEWLESQETPETPGRKMEARWFFYPDGKLLFLRPRETQHCHYTITDSALHIDWQNTNFTELKFELKDNVLILHEPDGSEERFSRY
jgi:hypothetical protein